MITVPNQKIVRIEKEPCGKGNLYAAINLKALEAAAQNLDAGAFKLWIYFAKNQNGYEFALSSKDASLLCFAEHYADLCSFQLCYNT